MNLDHEIGDGELQLISPQSAGFVAREDQTRPEIEQDIRGLRDDELADLEDGANGGRAPRLSSMIFIIAGTPALPLRRATST